MTPPIAIFTRGIFLVLTKRSAVSGDENTSGIEPKKSAFIFQKKKKLFPNWSTGLEVKSSVDEYNTSVPNPDNLREHDLDLYLTLQPNT